MPELDLVARVMGTLNRLIREDGLSPGDPVPGEAAVAAKLGISRPVVREAFRSLAALGVLDIGNGRRARVATINPSVLSLVVDHAVHTNQASVLQVLDVRRTLETRAAALAALHRSDREAREIGNAAAVMRAALHDTQRVMEHDITFHMTIARASRNPVFTLVIGSFETLTRKTWPVGWASRVGDEDRLASIAVHEAIAAAIQDCDPHAAEEAMARHFDETATVLLRAGIN